MSCYVLLYLLETNQKVLTNKIEELLMTGLIHEFWSKYLFPFSELILK